jgi:hypothetical protein
VAITCSGGGAANYAFVYPTSHVTVAKANLFVVPRAQTVAHGTRVPAKAFYTFVYRLGSNKGPVVVPTITSHAPTCSDAKYRASSRIGTYRNTITCAGGTATKSYSFHRTSKASLVVIKKPVLYVVPAAKRIVAGRSAGKGFYTWTYYSDTAHKHRVAKPAITKAPTCTSSYTKTTPADRYLISCSGGRSSRYVLNETASSILTVTPAR